MPPLQPDMIYAASQQFALIAYYHINLYWSSVLPNIAIMFYWDMLFVTWKEQALYSKTAVDI
jgi:hypothetical protein